jgi:hypothetical protein
MAIVSAVAAVPTAVDVLRLLVFPTFLSSLLLLASLQLITVLLLEFNFPPFPVIPAVVPPMARVSTVDAFPTLPTGISNVPSVPAHVDFSAVAGVTAIVLLLRFLLLLVRMLLLPPCSCCSF